MLRTALLTALLLPACASVQSPHVVSSQIQLAGGGRATAHLSWTAPPTLFVRLDNRGPGNVTYAVHDAQGQPLEQGLLQRGVKTLDWKRADGKVRLTLEADAAGAWVDYRVSSQEGVSVELDLTHASKKN